MLRDLGVEEEATAVRHAMGASWATPCSPPAWPAKKSRGCGPGAPATNRIGDYLQGSPCPLLDIPQPYMEPVLVKNAAERGAQIAFNTEYLSHVQDEPA